MSLQIDYKTNKLAIGIQNQINFSKNMQYNYPETDEIIIEMVKKLFSGDIESIKKSLIFFDNLIRNSEIPEHLLDNSFILKLVNVISQIDFNIDIYYLFGKIIHNYYNYNEDLIPPPELINFVQSIFMNQPLPETPEKLEFFLPYIRFMAIETPYLTCLHNKIYYEKIIWFLGKSNEYNSAIFYLLQKILELEISSNLFSLFSHVIDVFFSLVDQNELVINDPNSFETLENFTNMTLSFLEKFEMLGMRELLKDIKSNRIMHLNQFWNISSNININLLMICTHLDNEDIAFLGCDGYNIILKMIIEKSSTEQNENDKLCLLDALHIFEVLLEKKQKSFYDKLEEETFESVQFELLKLCLEGTIREKIAAGKCVCLLTMYNPMEAYQIILKDLEVHNDPKLLSDPRNQSISQLAPLSIMQSLLNLDNDKLNIMTIKALYQISKCFYNSGKMHEFREATALYHIEEIINGIIDKESTSDELYDLANTFNQAAFGIFPYDEADKYFQ